MNERDTGNAPSPGNAKAPGDAERLRDYARLVSDLIHEFRTPLGSIVGAASVLNQYGEALEEPVRSRVCSGIMEQAHHLDHLLTALAAMARARTGTLVREARTFELNELLRGLSGTFHARQQTPAGISLPREEIFLETDPAAVGSLISIMLSLAHVYASGDDDVALSLASEANAAVVTVDSAVRDDERSRAINLVAGYSPGASLELRATTDAVYLAAIHEIVHILGGELRIQYMESAGRLCQTARLQTKRV